MNKKLILLSGSSALLIAGFLTLARPGLAYQGDPAVKGPEYSPERHAAMTSALSQGDYQAWKSLMGDRGVTRKVTAQNFARFAEAHALAAKGDIAGAQKIRAEIGLGTGDRNGAGSSGSFHKGVRR